MPVIHLNDRALIHLSGADAEHFLQNLITPDLGALAEDEAKPSALLSPQGKILFDFLISRAGDGAFALECRADRAGDLMRRLMLYKLRAKIEISQTEQKPVAVSWEDDSGPSQNDSTALRDMRFSRIAVWRRYSEQPPTSDDDVEWHRLRIRHGVAESGHDYELGDAFPHDVLLDQNGGVGLRKGCYVGQEVVSRMQHRGTARRRLLIATGQADLPTSGAEITVSNRVVGSLGTVVDAEGLAIARIDRVKAAIDAGTPIEAGGVALSLAIPDWANFTFPDTESEAGQAG